MPSEPALVDTNILVETLYQDAPHHAAARGLLSRAQDGQVTLCLSPQVLAEFYAVVTNPRRVSSPLTPQEAISEVAKYLAEPQLFFLPVPSDLVSRWVKLLERYPVKGGRSFDVQLVATMLANGVERIYTFDSPHFDVFDEIEAMLP